MPILSTPFERSDRTVWTSLEEGEQFLLDLVEAYPRLRYMILGYSVRKKPVTAVSLGYPAFNPANPTVLIVSGQHGLERASREAVFMLIRDMAESEDPVLIEYLKTTNWIFIPTASPDMVGIDRPNANGINLNRDWEVRSQPETKAMYSVIAQHHPVLIVDAHEGRDFTTNFATSAILDPAIHPRIREESAKLDYAVKTAVEVAGRTHQQYNLPDGLGLLSTAAGIFGAVGLLIESRRTDNDASPAPSERVADQEIALDAVLSFHQKNKLSILEAASVVPRKASMPLGDRGRYIFRSSNENIPVLEIKTKINNKTYSIYKQK